MSFSGSGGPPPQQAREQGLAGGQKPYGFRFYEKLANGKNKRVGFIALDKGEENCPILILDPSPPGDNEWNPSVYLHERFTFNGDYQNYAVCRHKSPEGCALDVALQSPHEHAPWCKIGSEHGDDECKRLGHPQNKRGSWRWICTAIKLKPFTFEKGKLAGKTVPFQRGLIIAPEDQYKTLLTYRKAWGGLRGRTFNVSRGNGQFSPRIGEKWDPSGAGAMTDEAMMAKFAAAAADYGLDIGDYLKPMDYETILKLPTVAEMAEIAKWVAGERGVSLTGGTVSTTTPEANPVAAAVGELPDDDLPF